jgi:hypothetical protein
MLDIAILLRNLGAEQRSIVVQHIQPPEMRNGLRDRRLDAVSLFQIQRDRQSARQPSANSRARSKAISAIATSAPRRAISCAVAQPIPLPRR